MMALQKFLNHLDKIVWVAIIDDTEFLLFAKCFRQLKVHYSNVLLEGADLSGVAGAVRPLASVRTIASMRALVSPKVNIAGKGLVAVLEGANKVSG